VKGRLLRGAVVSVAALVAATSASGHAAAAAANMSATPASSIATATPSLVSATLDASPRSVTFASEVVGHRGQPSKIQIVNRTAGVAVTLRQPTVSSGFSVTSNNCPLKLQGGASCTIGVASFPVAKGKQKGSLQVNSNASFGSRTVKLKGNGVAPKMKANPQSLNFGPVKADSVSTAQSITVVNRSPVPISFATAPAATPPFNVSANTCDTIAANGGTCTVSVEFAPHDRGKFEGTLELHDNAARSPQHIKLFGRSK
jgi:Abnormal spindle-like microcephaly-assoc'd, ASPM-SPD-2-Hydin